MLARVQRKAEVALKQYKEVAVRRLLLVWLLGQSGELPG
jgi:hypothetical protein